MLLSKSGYIAGLQCPRRLWLQKNGGEEFISEQSHKLTTLGHEVGEAALLLLGTPVKVEQARPLEMVKKTESLISASTPLIAEAAFLFEGCYCQADILKVVGNKDVEVYEVKSTTKIEPYHLEDIAFQYYVISHTGYNVRKFYHLHLNKDYLGITGKIDAEALFEKTDVTEDILRMQKDVPEKIQKCKTYMSRAYMEPCNLGTFCKKPTECEFIKHCCKEHGCEDNSRSVQNIQGMFWRDKANLINAGVSDFESYRKSGVQPKFSMQVDYELEDKGLFVNKSRVNDFLHSLSYPLYNLDYESIQQDVPLYDGVRPYQQVPFQYSLHIMGAPNKELLHKEFLAEEGKDPRRALAEKLCSDIPYGACVLAYNASFEKSITKELSNQFPDLAGHLTSFDFKDLMIPFKNKDVYCKEMQGSYSIKYVLPALFPNEPSLDYHNLEDVQNGTMAMDAYRSLPALPPSERAHLRNRLLRYCELDTYAMVCVLRKLYEFVQ